MQQGVGYVNHFRYKIRWLISWPQNSSGIFLRKVKNVLLQKKKSHSHSHFWKFDTKRGKCIEEIEKPIKPKATRHSWFLFTSVLCTKKKISVLKRICSVPQSAPNVQKLPKLYHYRKWLAKSRKTQDRLQRAKNSTELSTLTFPICRRGPRPPPWPPGGSPPAPPPSPPPQSPRTWSCSGRSRPPPPGRPDCWK